MKKEKLVPYNSKVVPEIKEITDALVAIKANGCKSQHELIKDMLRVYEEANPQAFAAARRYIVVMSNETAPPKIFSTDSPQD